MTLNSRERRSHRCSERLYLIHADGSKACCSWPPKDLGGRTLEEYSRAVMAIYKRRDLAQKLIEAEVVSPGSKVLQRWTATPLVAIATPVVAPSL